MVDAVVWSSVLVVLVLSIPLIGVFLMLVRAWDREVTTPLLHRIEDLELQVQRLEKHHPSPFGS